MGRSIGFGGIGQRGFVRVALKRSSALIGVGFAISLAVFPATLLSLAGTTQVLADGGDGGRGGGPSDGDGGAGGTGTSPNGTDGSDGMPSGPFGGGGDGGGGGGGGTSLVTGIGGDGGTGGTGQNGNSPVPGTGGNGGDVGQTTASELDVNSSLAGQNGDPGSNIPNSSYASSGGGGGGGGGFGLVVTGPDLAITNNDDITGGNGGNGSCACTASQSGYGGGGGGGSGGGGILMQNGGLLDNTGTIAGGNGGNGGSSGLGEWGNGGDGGGGVIGANLTIINNGLIAGGTGASGQANAITFTGGTNRLELHDGFDFTGNVVVESGATGTLVLGGDDNASFDVSALTDAPSTDDGSLVGFNAFEKTGTSVWTLTGDGTGFTGTSTINAGTLVVGDANGNGTLGGSLDVFDGARLGGSGTVGSGAGSLVTVASGGTLAPGNSIGTLTVDGNLTFAADSYLDVEVNPEGTDSDRVEVTGTATLDGGTVAHIEATGEYDIRSTYTILSAETLEGAFDEVTTSFSFLNPDLIYDYDAGTVDLELVRNDRDFASTALTRNQIATADGVESIGFDAGHAVYNAIAQLSGDDALIRASFDALSGEIHASGQSARIEDSRFVRNAANDRIRAAFATAGASFAPVLAYGPGDTPVLVSADHGGPVFWSQAFGSWGSADSDGNAAHLDRSIGGVLIGADSIVGDWRVGLLAGYSQSRFDAQDRAASGSRTNYHLGLYGGTEWGDVALRTGAAYTWHDAETSRSVVIPGLTDSLLANYNAGTFQAFAELGYGFELDPGTRLEPFANLAHVSLHTDGFTESGGASALSVDSGTTGVTFTTLGVRGEHSLSFGTVDATLSGMIGWRHAFGDTTPQSTHAFSAGDAFTIAGAPIARNSALIEAGLDLDLTPQATFGLSYQGQIASEAQDHGLKANLSVRF